MKEYTKSYVAEIEAINPTTGELFKLHGEATESSAYYNISKITSRINAMDLLTKMAETCKSPKDISILNRLLDTAYSDNTIRIDNVTTLAEEYEVARSKLNGLLKAFEKAGLFKKLDRGIYFINPFIFVGKRVKSNELREAAQQKWRSI
jgi:hypothetical protein